MKTPLKYLFETNPQCQMLWTIQLMLVSSHLSYSSKWFYEIPPPHI